jgi:hypothetical protein
VVKVLWGQWKTSAIDKTGLFALTLKVKENAGQDKNVLPIEY